MNENNQFGTNTESAEDPMISSEAAPDISEDPDSEKETTAETEECGNQAESCTDGEQSTESTESSSPCEPTGASPDCPQQDNGNAAEMKAELEKISNSIAESAEANKKISAELYEIHRLYHNEFAGRLKSMQDELDTYHRADQGRAFDDILSAIARIYGNNETLADEIADPRSQKHVKYMLLDILELLEEYGVQRLKSNPGDKRNPRHCQVLDRIPTDDPALHDTVAASHCSGFYKGNRTIIKEMVDVYLYEFQTTTEDKTEAAAECEADNTITEQDNLESGGNLNE